MGHQTVPAAGGCVKGPKRFGECQDGKHGNAQGDAPPVRREDARGPPLRGAASLGQSPGHAAERPLPDAWRAQHGPTDGGGEGAGDGESATGQVRLTDVSFPEGSGVTPNPGELP